MKAFFKIVFTWKTLESVVLSWGSVALIFAVTSLFWPEIITMELMRTLLFSVSVTAITSHWLFSQRDTPPSPRSSIWGKRLSAFVTSFTIIMLIYIVWYKKAIPWQSILVTLGGAAILCSIAYFIADAVERRSLAKINEKLGQNE